MTHHALEVIQEIGGQVVGGASWGGGGLSAAIDLRFFFFDVEVRVVGFGLELFTEEISHLLIGDDKLHALVAC